jgi:hypothetical protein
MVELSSTRRIRFCIKAFGRRALEPGGEVPREER